MLPLGSVATGVDVRRSPKPRSWPLVALAGLLAAACGGSASRLPLYQDPQYHRSATQLVRVAILPVPQSDDAAVRFDQGLGRVFMGTPGMSLARSPVDVRAALNGAPELLRAVSAVQNLRHPSGDLAAANLAQALSPKQLDGLREQLVANILVVPVEFSVRTAGGHSEGSIGYRAYDLESGRLLRQNGFVVEAPESGEPGTRRVLVDLVLRVHDDFTAHLL
jgi:hypothetical protein